MGGLGKALAQFYNAERLHYCHKKCWKQKKYHLAYVVETSLLVFLVTLKLPRIALPIHILVSVTYIFQSEDFGAKAKPG